MPVALPVQVLLCCILRLRQRLLQALRRLCCAHLLHGRPIPTHIDRVHHRQRATHAEREPQEKPDHRTRREVHLALRRRGCTRGRSRRRIRLEDLQRILHRVRQTPARRHQHDQPCRRDQRRRTLLYRFLSHRNLLKQPTIDNGPQCPDPTGARFRSDIQCFSATGLTSRFATNPTTSSPVMMWRMVGYASCLARWFAT